MKYLSVCSGIEAATCAWHDLGWEPWAFSEIEAFPSSVLAHHYPNVPNLGDMTKFKEWPDATIDLLVGGTPCQSFSIAGLRKGLDDPRGNLMLTYLAIAHKYRPRWLVWENVPGVLSSGGGADFACLLRGMGELGYGFAYRILDAQYFGVAQRRRRVFVVGHLGDWRRAAAVLFERHSLQGNPPPRREARQGVARPIASSSRRGSGYRNDADTADNLIAGTLQANGKAAGNATQQDAESGLLLAFGGNNTSGPIDVATARNACASASGRMDFETETFIAHSLRAQSQPSHRADSDTYIAHALRGEGFDASEDGTGRGTPLVPVAHCDVMPTLMNGANTPAGHSARSGHSKDSYIVPVGFAWQAGGDGTASGSFVDDGVPTLQKSQTMAVAFDPHGGGKQTTLGASEDGTGALGATKTPAVAYSTKLHNTSSNQAGKFYEEYTAGLDANSPAPAIAYSIMPMNSSRDYKAREVDVAQPLMAGGHVGGNQGGDFIAQPVSVALRGRDGGATAELGDEVGQCLRSSKGGGDKPHVLSAMQVRRLIPRECERLQGFKDDYTRIPMRTYQQRRITKNRPVDMWERNEDGTWTLMSADGPRYKALGNSMAVTVMRWIGERIEMAEQIKSEREAA